MTTHIMGQAGAPMCKQPIGDEDTVTTDVHTVDCIECHRTNFRLLCHHHDYSYAYSDDGRAYSRGSQRQQEIRAYGIRHLPDDCRRIWNEVADRKFVDPYNRQFYWR